ncbi:MAG: hypothetical protein JJ908_11210 [Rhizobiales bacterium]|nr:hypothetical protein [Hyphomicrobiales bacterium]MBO6699390.1 hypothetical protein [Hyphomicrobiales bacterium]MBO6736928.1 hypothetical protein [Hyphomicrobiales bacterium]MBO6911998.1 hypothetical protein [Hyphomicrobiales bacterium]MBO6954634.1 hypothetical protein [Hyphomicrobiales bacterium]
MERLKAYWPKSRVPNLTHTPTGSLKAKPAPPGQSRTHCLQSIADRTACSPRPYRFDFLSHSCPYEEQRTEPTVNASTTTSDSALWHRPTCTQMAVGHLAPITPSGGIGSQQVPRSAMN